MVTVGKSNSISPVSITFQCGGRAGRALLVSVSLHLSSLLSHEVIKEETTLELGSKMGQKLTVARGSWGMLYAF